MEDTDDDDDGTTEYDQILHCDDQNDDIALVIDIVPHNSLG